MGANERNYSSTAAVFSFPSGISETTVVTVNPSQHTDFRGVWLDLVNLTQDATIRARQELHDDGVFYTFETRLFDVADTNKGILIASKVPASGDLRITIQSGIAEGASRNIPYEVHRVDLSNVS